MKIRSQIKTKKSATPIPCCLWDRRPSSSSTPAIADAGQRFCLRHIRRQWVCLHHNRHQRSLISYKCSTLLFLVLSSDFWFHSFASKFWFSKHCDFNPNCRQTLISCKCSGGKLRNYNSPFKCIHRGIATFMYLYYDFKVV